MGIRRALSVIFALIGGVIAVLGLLVVIADKQIFDQPTVEHSVDRILADPDVSRLLGREISKRAVALGNLGTEQALVEAYVGEQVKTAAVQAEIRSAALDSYRTLMHTTDPRIDFNMSGQARQVRTELVQLDPTLDARLPASSDLLRFTLFRRSSLPWVYNIARQTRSAAWTLFIVGAGLVVLALALGPGRLGLFVWVSFVMTIGMLSAGLFASTGRDRVIGRIEDPLSRRVARLSTDEFLAKVTHLALGVVIFGAVAFVAGLGAMWIRGAYYPPKPKVVRVTAVPPIPPPPVHRESGHDGRPRFR